MFRHIRSEYNINPGREAVANLDGLSDGATVDVQKVWDAAANLGPDDLDDNMPLTQVANGDGGLCPNCADAVEDAVRALAVEDGALNACDATLDASTYSEYYRRLRAEYGAPLPRYLTRETVADEWATVTGALDALTFDHLDREALRSEVTAEGDDASGEDVRLRLDPAYRESESGESLLVFDDGTIYDSHPEYDDTLPSHAFVAHDSRVIRWDRWLTHGFDLLSGDIFIRVYKKTRLYDAPHPNGTG